MNVDITKGVQIKSKTLKTKSFGFHSPTNRSIVLEIKRSWD